MDFNDISVRLKRLQSATSNLEYSDDGSSANISEILLGTAQGFSITFGNQEEHEIANKVMAVIGLVSSLKDNLKNKCRQLGKNPKIVEDLINDNQSLSLIIDIYNSEKHGYPLTKPSRSGRNPKIKELFQAKDFTTGNIEIAGRVVDQDDEWIIDLDDMIPDAVKIIEDFIKLNNLTENV